MSDETVRLSAVGKVLRGRWRLLVVFAAVGALVGAIASLMFSPGYETSASVLLQGPRQADELLTEAQVATSSVVLDRAAEGLGLAATGTELRKSVSASIANGNVIEIAGAADTPEQAQQLTDRVAQEFVKYSTQLVSNTADASAQLQREQRETLRQQVGETTQKVTDLSREVTGGLTVESVQVRTQLEALRTSLHQAMNDLNQADAATSLGNMVVMGPSERPSSAAAPTMPQLVAGGAVLFFLLGLLGHLFSARSDRRLRGEREIGAALGTEVLVSVDVPEVPRPAEVGEGVAARLRRLVVADRPWNVPEVKVSAAELTRPVPYQRLLTRLTEGDGARLLVLVATDDLPAHGAVADLAESDQDPDSLRSGLRVLDIEPDRPVLPDGSEVSGVLVVLTAGTRTGVELAGIAEACADAGQEVVGAVLLRQVRPTGRPGEPARVNPSKVELDRDAMAGSA